MEKAPPLVLLGGADAHDLVLVEMLIDDCPNIIFVVLTSLNPIIPLRPKEVLSEMKALLFLLPGIENSRHYPSEQCVRSCWFYLRMCSNGQGRIDDPALVFLFFI